MKKRFFAVWLCVIMCLSMISVTALAEEPAEEGVFTEAGMFVEEEIPAVTEEPVNTEKPAEEVMEVSNPEAPIEEVMEAANPEVPAEEILETPIPEEMLLGAGGGVEINEANFPDEVFRAYVSDTFDSDESGTLTDDEIAAATGIYVWGKEISSLKGLEFFTALEALDCNLNKLTELNVSANTALTWLDCGSNQLESLDVSANTALKELTCYGNKLMALDVSANTALEVLDCQATCLCSLDLSTNIALKALDCGSNQLESLDVSNCLQLEELLCPANYLSKLDVGNNTALTVLICADNFDLNSLDVSNNTALTYLECASCGLTELDVTNCSYLEELFCSQNWLTTLDLSSNTQLANIQCDMNNLSEINVSNCALLECLMCGINNLTELDVSKNTELIQLWCPINHLTGLDLNGLSNLCELICDNNDLTELDIRPTQSCMDELNTGYFGFMSGDSGITVFMTAGQKAGFDTYFADNDRNKDVVAVVGKPVIITQPADYSGVVGSSAAFSVAANGEGLSYRWEYCAPGKEAWEECSQTGSKTDKLSVPVTEEFNGQKFRCKVTDCYGEFLYSNAATLTVKSDPKDPVSPDTGDNSPIALWLMLMFICGTAIAAAEIKCRKSEN